VRVVSMPCWELFETQSAGYRDEVLPPEVRARLSVEPGVALGWSKWVGDRGSSISIEHFGASAPGTTVLEQFGYNLDNVVARASALLERVS
jgi:transketolase